MRGCLQLRAATLVLLACACGPSPTDADGGAGTRGSGSGGTAATSSTSNTGAPGDGAGSGDAADDSGGEPPTVFDVGGPPGEPCSTFQHCPLGRSGVVQAAGETPSGPFDAVDAVFGHDYCTRLPMIRLGDAPLQRGGEPADTAGTRQIKAMPMLAEPLGYVEAGTYPAGFQDCGGVGFCGFAIGTIEFLEPIDLAAVCDLQLAPILHVDLYVDVDGWDYAAEVHAPLCGAFNDCSCPCE